LKDLFAELIEDARKTYLKIIEGKSRDKAVEAMLEHFRDEEPRHEYYYFFKKYQRSMRSSLQMRF